MRVGLMFDLRTFPGERVDRTYDFTLEICEAADRLGIGGLWMSEHHLFDDGYLPQPLVFAAAVAVRTERARVGTAVLNALLRPAVDIAEQAAIVDAISGGRLELGLGAGYRQVEADLYGAGFAHRFEATDERVREIRRIWADGEVKPGPVQTRPSIWLGYQGPRGARRAGRLGENLLSLKPGLLGPYVEGLEEGGHEVSSARIGGPVMGYVSEDPEADWPAVSRSLARQYDSYNRHAVIGTDSPLPPPIDPERWRVARREGEPPCFVLETPEGMADHLRERFAGAPVEHVLFWARPGDLDERTAHAHVLALARLQELLTGTETISTEGAE
jgi:alkanesulfonate monooxygenase SsuD/methylene tetrahydromethanopterin reductase-like flavin-dependent oxidoreductase (luciferase family)